MKYFWDLLSLSEPVQDYVNDIKKFLSYRGQYQTHLDPYSSS